MKYSKDDPIAVEQLSRMQKLVGVLMLLAPFWGSVALKLALVVDFTCKTAYTDGKVIGFNPFFTAKLNKGQALFLIGHEVAHVILKHMLRCGSRNAEKFNEACDFAINWLLVEAGWGEFIPSGLLDKQYRGMSSELIYNLRKREEQEKPQSGSDSSDDDDQSDEPKEYGPDDVPDFDDAGSDIGEVRAAPEGEESDIENDLEQVVNMAAATAQRAGKMSGGLVELVNGRNDPVVDWTQMLDDFVSSAGNIVETSWSRPNRRLLDIGYFPGNVRHGFEHAVIAVDTSGSMSKEWIKQSCSEALAICEKLGPRVTFIPCDSKMQGVQEYQPNEYPEEVDGFEIKGRGGTSLEPVFDWIEENGEPDVLIYFTDGDVFSWPDEPDYPVFWGMVKDNTPPWGESVRIT